MSLILADLFVGFSYRWWQSKLTRHHAAPNADGADPDIDLAVVAVTPSQATRHRHPVLGWLLARQGSYFFPLLLLEGVSLHVDSLRRVLRRGQLKRRWVEIGLLTVRLGGLAALVLVVLPPTKAAVFLIVQLAVFGLYMGASFAPNHIGMPLVPARLKLDFLRRQVLMSRDISGGRLTSAAMGASTTRSSTTCSRPCRAPTCATSNPSSRPTAPPSASPTLRPHCGSPTVRWCATSTPSDS